MVTNRGMLGKSVEFISIAMKVPSEDAQFSEQHDFNKTATMSPCCPCMEYDKVKFSTGSLNLLSTDSSQQFDQVCITNEKSVLLVSNESTNTGILLSIN